MRNWPILLVLLLPLLTAARSAPPAVEQPAAGAPRNFTISAANLTITPGENHSYLRFSGGIRAMTGGMELTADLLELDLETTEVTGGSELKLPEPNISSERVVEDPGAIVRSMAAEMEVPRAKFSASAIKRVGAAGNVQIQSEQLSLTTAELVSTDGGRSWAAEGRSTLSRSEADSSYALSADYLLYDTQTQKALARGAIRGRYLGETGVPALISAERVELDVARSIISASEYLEVTYKGYTLRTGSLIADIAGRQISAGDAPRIVHPELGLSAAAAGIEVDLARMILSARGGINVEDRARDLKLRAGELTAYLNQDRLVASGDPHLEQGTSTFDGKRIVVTQVNGKTVVEVEGPQRARLNIEELEAQREKEAEAPPAEEPPSDSNTD